ncbi:MAG: hypothetical protein ABSB42_05150 [Tepidisphaeraceae bacterium]|jgi:hypothetical protein
MSAKQIQDLPSLRSLSSNADSSARQISNAVVRNLIRLGVIATKDRQNPRLPGG